MTVPITRAAEGLPRRAFTVAEVERMVEVGLLHEDDRIELIGGELVPMSPKGIAHERAKLALQEYWSSRRSPHIRMITETNLYFDQFSYVEPDFLFFERITGLANISPANVLLVVEVSDSSLDYDLGRKASIYAARGVRDYWVIDALELVTTIYRDPAEGEFKTVSRHEPSDRLVPLLAPDLAVVLAELEFD